MLFEIAFRMVGINGRDEFETVFWEFCGHTANSVVVLLNEDRD